MLISTVSYLFLRVVFFFFKQKTAYEMRISDWSSDVCSSDLGDHVVAGKALFGSCRWLTDTLLPKFGIETTTVDATDNAAWEAAIRPNTKEIGRASCRERVCQYV